MEAPSYASYASNQPQDTCKPTMDAAGRTSLVAPLAHLCHLPTPPPPHDAAHPAFFSNLQAGSFCDLVPFHSLPGYHALPGNRWAAAAPCHRKICQVQDFLNSIQQSQSKKIQMVHQIIALRACSCKRMHVTEPLQICCASKPDICRNQATTAYQIERRLWSTKLKAYKQVGGIPLCTCISKQVGRRTRKEMIKWV